MSETKADVILHPVRLRIIQCLAGGGHMTSYQLQEKLHDIPQATLYRHLKKLKEAGILIVTDERPNRGAMEKVYALPEHAAEISKEELERASAEDHLTYFINFLAHLIGEYGRYIKQPDVNLVKDGVTYRQFILYLTDEENLEMLLAFRGVMARYKDNQPDEHRKKRLIATIGHPAGE